MRARQPRNLFGERDTRAPRRGAAEPADHHVDLDSGTRDRDIHQQPPVPTVHPGGGKSAVWAPSLRGAGTDTEPQPVASSLPPFEDHMREMRKQDPEVRETRGT